METPATPPPTMTTRAALIDGASRRGDHDAVVGRESQRDRLPALEENAGAVRHVHPQRSAVDGHLEPHEGPEERGDLEHAVKSVAPVVRRALGDDAELLGAERQDDPVAVSAAVESDPQALAFPVHDARPGRDDRTAEEVRNTDEVGDEVGAGSRVDLDRAPDLLDPAVPHHRDAVGDRERLLLVVGDVDRRDPEVLLDLADLAAKSKADLRVERRERLIEQEDFRPAGERSRERDSLLLAARELVRVPALEATEARQRDHLGDALVGSGGRPSGHPQTEGNVLGDGHSREERVRLEDDADAALAWRHVVDDAAVEADLARVGSLEAGDHAERRRLAAARAADEGDELPLADLQGEPVHGGRRAEALRQAVEADAHVSGGTSRASASRAAPCRPDRPPSRSRWRSGSSRRSSARSRRRPSGGAPPRPTRRTR